MSVLLLLAVLVGWIMLTKFWAPNSDLDLWSKKRYRLVAPVAATLTAMAVAAFVIPLCLPMDRTETYTESIRSLQDGSETTGKWYFLGSGSLNGQLVFTAYTGTNGTYIRRTYPATQTVIHENATNETAKVVWAREVRDGNMWFPWRNNTTEPWRFDIYVPPGSVTETIQLDNK